MKTNQPAAEPTAPAYSLWDLALYVLRLGTFGFGGPVALAAVVGLIVFPMIRP
jgi:chromate transport protein ChrA